LDWIKVAYWKKQQIKYWKIVMIEKTVNGEKLRKFKSPVNVRYDERFAPSCES